MKKPMSCKEKMNAVDKSSVVKGSMIGAGLLVLLSFGIYWLCENPSKAGIYYVVGLLNCILSACVFAGYVPSWVAFWSKDGSPELCRQEEMKLCKKIFFTVLGMTISTIVLVLVIAYLMLEWFRLDSGLSFWLCTDSMHYMDIAREWYLSDAHIDRLVQLVFFPGYPILVRVLDFLIHNLLYSGLLVSGCSLVAATWMLYKLICLDADEKTALRAVKYLLICPCVFFYIAPMSDSLFLFLCIACIYFVRTDRVWLGCLLGGFASFTRSLGVTLMVPVFLEVVHKLLNSKEVSKKTVVMKLLPIVAIAWGFLAYLYINYDVSGNPFQFMIYQREHWGQRLGLYFDSAARYVSLIQKCVTEGYLDALFGKVIPNLISCFLPLVLILITGKKLRASYVAWFIIYYMVSIGTTSLLSGPRYMMSCFPLFLSMSLISKDKKMDLVLTILSICMFLLYMIAFVNRWGVW